MSDEASVTDETKVGSTPESPLARLRKAKRDERTEHATRLATLAESARVWFAAFNNAGGAIGDLARDLPTVFLVEYLARARLQDAIALACDGAECNLLAHARQTLVMLVGDDAAQQASRELVQLFADDRVAQARMLAEGGTQVVREAPP